MLTDPNPQSPIHNPPNTSTPYFYMRDHLGSVREMTDANGVIQARYDYDPWGNRNKLSGGLDADMGFTGHYYHATSGLNLAPYRAYDSAIGRWLNRDPIGEMGGLDLYTYVLQNPTNWGDRFGLDLRLETTNQVYGLHERLSVDTPSGPYGQSFGMIRGDMPFQESSDAFGNEPGPGVPGSGVVYPDSDPMRRVEATFKMSPQEDALVLQLLQQQLNNTGPYHPLTRSCRNYSEEQFRELQDQIIRQRWQQHWNNFLNWLGNLL